MQRGHKKILGGVVEAKLTAGVILGQNKPFLANLVLVSALKGVQRPTWSEIYVEFFFTPQDRVSWGCKKNVWDAG